MSFLLGVQSGEVDSIWEQVKPLIESPIYRTGCDKDMDAEDVKAKLLTTDSQLWIVHENAHPYCAIITTIQVFPKRKVLAIPFVGCEEGYEEDWVEHLEYLKTFAAHHGCAGIRGWGRKGWERVLNPDRVRIEFDIDIGGEYGQE